MSADQSTATVDCGVSPFDHSRAYRSPDSDVSTTLALALADVEGVSATDLDFAVADYVDPDALNRLCGGDDDLQSTNAVVHLDIAGHEVCVTDGGDVFVHD